MYQATRDAGVPGAGTIKNKTLLVTCWSGLLDACLERAGLREDKDLHSEAWVLVTRATDTLEQGWRQNSLQTKVTR
jgi:hypothetical protein